MNTVLDHQMIPSCVGCLLQYGSKLKGGGDGKIVAFNGEHAEGPLQGTTIETRTCVQGTELNGKSEPSGPALHLATSPALVAAGDYDTDMVRHPGGCLDERYASYDEHPGYDYQAAMGSEVYAASGGYVVNNGDWFNGHASARCVVTNLPPTIPPAVILHGCAAFNFVGIDHGNQYISQYGHLRDVDPALEPPCLTDQLPLHCEVWVNEGQLIGHSGDTGVAGSPHLHFEVIALIPGSVYDRTKIATYDPLHWTVVDPYGWVAGLADPLFYPMGDPLESFQKYHIWHSNLWK